MIFEVQVQHLDPTLDVFCADSESTMAAFSCLDLVDLNVVLYRADGEEHDATNGVINAYDVPGVGKLTYCGLEGWMSLLRAVMRYNDLGHPLCENLRKGTWALDYTLLRLFR
jgi:glycogen debranching enzyme